MTAQLEEIIIIDGEKKEMAFCPPIPENHPRIILRDPSEKNWKNGILNSTACWRGYQGTWEIKDKHFYLVRLKGSFKIVGKKPILADWFSGILRIPRGELLKYVHMGFGSVYEEELHVQVEKGLVVGITVLDNRECDHDEYNLAWQNLPGNENRFPGDGKVN